VLDPILRLERSIAIDVAELAHERSDEVLLVSAGLPVTNRLLDRLAVGLRVGLELHERRRDRLRRLDVGADYIGREFSFAADPPLGLRED
jgi:hypothetical protein